MARALLTAEKAPASKALRLISSLGCLGSVLAFIGGVVVYPRAKWLFVLPLIAISLLLFAVLTRKRAGPMEVADRAEALLNGTSGPWGVDDYEHLNPKPEQLNDLWRKTMKTGGLPEEWPTLDDQRKTELRDIIAEIRQIELPVA